MLSVAAGIGAFLIIAFFALIPPLGWHIRCKNIPAIILIFWLMYGDLSGFINIMIWSGSDFETSWMGIGWCDLVIKLDAGATVGKCCAIACLSINLFMVLEAKYPLFLDQESWKKKAIDLVTCLATPIFVMAVQHIILARRFAIMKYNGCRPLFSSTYATIGLYIIWPLIWSIVAFIFAGMTVFIFFRKRKDVKDILVVTNSGLNMRRFARLLIFAFLIIFAMLPLSLYYCIIQVSILKTTFHWSDYHNENWNAIYFSDAGFVFIYDRLVNAILSILTFFLFGLGTDAINTYKSFFSKFGVKFGKKINDESQPLAANDEYVSSLHPQSKVNTNKLQFSNSTGFTNASTMRDIENQYGDIINEIMTEEPKTFRFDEGHSNSHATSDTKRDIDIQLREILDTVETPTEHFSYKYEVQQKPHN